MFPCDICHKTFDKYKNLFRHVKTHKVSLVVVTMVTFVTMVTMVTFVTMVTMVTCGLLRLQHFTALC